MNLFHMCLVLNDHKYLKIFFPIFCLLINISRLYSVYCLKKHFYLLLFIIFSFTKEFNNSIAINPHLANPANE